MNSKSTHKFTTRVSAFTILEVVIVLSIMSVLITIVAISTNRFQEQLKETRIIQEELNQFYAVRSQLWLELYESDSIQTESDALHIYRDTVKVNYYIEEDTLYRSTTNQGYSLHLAMHGIESNKLDDRQKIAFIFDWKDSPMRMEYIQPGGLKNKIDTYFEHYKR